MRSRGGTRAYFIDVSLIFMWRTFCIKKYWCKSATESLLLANSIQVGKAKDRPSVGQPDRTETVGPTKWDRPVSVQFRSGPDFLFGLGPKRESVSSLSSFLTSLTSSRNSASLTDISLLIPDVSSPGKKRAKSNRDYFRRLLVPGIPSELFIHSASR